MTEEDSTKLDIDWVKTIAGALAAITTAVLLSTLGAAGTLLGAALGSVAATVGTALYSQGLARSKAKLAAVQEQALQRVGSAQTEVRRAARRGDGAGLSQAEAQLSRAATALDEAEDETAPQPWRERLAGLPWKRIALLAATVFVVAMAAISVFEALTGKPVSAYTGGSDKDGGTSITRITGGDSSSDDTDDRGGSGDTGEGDDGDSGRQDTPDQGGAPDDEPTPSEDADPEPTPTDEPSDEPAPTPEAPTQSEEPRDLDAPAEPVSPVE